MDSVVLESPEGTGRPAGPDSIEFDDSPGLMDVRHSLGVLPAHPFKPCNQEVVNDWASRLQACVSARAWYSSEAGMG